jgi:hypothetical protein
MITVDTTRYEREHDHPPRGRGYWRFKLCTSRATERDHEYNSKTADQTYQQALSDARTLATRRRAQTIVVLP